MAFLTEYIADVRHQEARSIELQAVWEEFPYSSYLPLWLFFLKQLDGPVDVGTHRCVTWQNNLGLFKVVDEEALLIRWNANCARIPGIGMEDFRNEIQ